MERPISEEGDLLPEKVQFSSEEAALAARAVSDFTISSLRILEANWANESFHALFDEHGAEDSLVQIEQKITFLTRGSCLIKKLAQDENGQRNGYEFSAAELIMLGESLFHFGVHTSRDAHDALDPTKLVRVHISSDELYNVHQHIQNTKLKTRQLFMKIDPILESYRLERMIWEDSF